MDNELTQEIANQAAKNAGRYAMPTKWGHVTAREDCVIELAPGFTGQINGRLFSNPTDEPVEVAVSALTHEPKIKSRPTYTEITADPSKHDFNEANLEAMLAGAIELGHLPVKRDIIPATLHPSERARYQASLRHKDEIIAGLQEQLMRAADTCEAIARERDRLIGEKAAVAEIAKQYKLERDKAEEESRNLHDSSKGAKIARALANSGESHRHDGLKLFDHYY